MSTTITQDFRHSLAGQATVLQKIVAAKADWVEQKSFEFPLSSFKDKVDKSDRSFYDALAQSSHKRPAFILECKKASPSKGLIRDDFNLIEIAHTYKNYATAISVLTDEKYFQGNFKFIQQVRDVASQPILCKDFMISEYQVYLARYHQADAILLMLSVVDDTTYKILSELAHQLGMGVLTETSNEEELQRAIDLGAKVIGINNRNLHDLTIDLKRTERLAHKIPADRIIISESGIYNHQQVQEIKAFAHAFLIGSSLMGSHDLDGEVRKIIYGENKVCGLTRIADAQQTYDSGALYGGMIFVNKSKRYITIEQAQQLVNSVPLRFVGVFQNSPISAIMHVIENVPLFAVQLHGSESDEFIMELRQQLPSSCQIWRAISISTDSGKNVELVNLTNNENIDRYVLDSQHTGQQGGTGKTFDWSLIPNNIKAKSLLAGGINLQNIDKALQQGCLAVDLNSGIEVSPGLKDSEKLIQIFNTIIDY